MAFTEKILQFQIELANGEFSNHTTTKIIRNLPAKVEIGISGLPARDQAKIQIYGLKQDDLEALTFLNFRTLTVNQNKISVYAGDNETGLSLAYAGDIINSFPEFNSAPDVYLEIESIAGYYPGMLAVPPYTFKGSIPLADIIAEQAKNMGYTFVNEGETRSALNPYVKGTPIQKIITLAKSYNLDLTIHNNVVRLRAASKQGNIRKVLNKESGLLGYPSFTANGLRLRAEYQPGLELLDIIRVESSIPKATGNWQIVSLSHSLGYNMPDAPWFTNIEASYILGN